MNNQIKNIILFLSISLLVGLFFANQAQANGLSLDVIKECNFQYGGETCIAEFKIDNSTGRVLDGEAIFHVDFEGTNFDGEGIYPYFSIKNSGWLIFGDWSNGDTSTGQAFVIDKGESFSQLKIKTHPALHPGHYRFGLTLKGTIAEEEKEEEYTTSPTPIGGGGGGTPSPPAEEEEELAEEVIEEQGEVKGEAIEKEKEGAEEGIGGKAIPEGARGGEVAGEVVEEEMPEGEEEEIIILPGETEAQPSLLAAVGNIMTFGTGNAWVAIIAAIIVLAILIYLVYYFTQKSRRKKLK